jgi:hypothetical protein
MIMKCVNSLNLDNLRFWKDVGRDLFGDDVHKFSLRM